MAIARSTDRDGTRSPPSWLLQGRAAAGLRGLAAAALGLTVAVAAVAQGLPESAAALDADGDGRLQRSEASIELLPDFQSIDRDGSGSLDGFEIEAFERQRLRETAPAPVAPRRSQQSEGESAGRRRIETAEDLVRARDRNGDGRLELDEVPWSLHEIVLRLDLDSDGAVDLDEARRMDGGRAPSMAPAPVGRRTVSRTVSLMDTNGDGVLQKQEAPLALQEVFSRLDRNGDGAIDASEAARADADAAEATGPRR